MTTQRLTNFIQKLQKLSAISARVQQGCSTSEDTMFIVQNSELYNLAQRVDRLDSCNSKSPSKSPKKA